MDTLASHGNVRGRKVVLEILEAGLEAADPYNNTRRLVRVDNGMLVVGNKEFEPTGTPISGNEVYDLSEVGRRKRREGASKLPDGRPCSREDVYGPHRPGL